MTPPELWLPVGGNGAGKPTFHDRFLDRSKTSMVNADNFARSLRPDHPGKHSYEAALIVEKERFRLVRRKPAFRHYFADPSASPGPSLCCRQETLCL
ncbi:hypothetical protein [Modicisalibacter muralis]|uniref:hypothetical protein n=1 Tax=Modicisalibacter muralis TaxID=119000 RepID=UPI0011141A4F|nr:hypothetical protein [Halomonas muralis]